MIQDMGTVEGAPHISLEIHLNGPCTHLQIGTGNMLWVLSAGDDSSESEDTADQLQNDMELDHLDQGVPNSPPRFHKHSNGMKRKFNAISEQLKQLGFRTEEGFLDLAEEIDQLNEHVDTEAELFKRELVLAKEKIFQQDNLIVRLQKEMYSLQNAQENLQQQFISLKKRCSDPQIEPRIKQSETQSEKRSGRDAKFPELDPCPLLILVGRLSVREIQTRTRVWLKIRDKWFIEWRAWIHEITNCWMWKDHVPDKREVFFQEIRQWIRIIREGVELYIEFHGQLIRHYKYVKKLPRSTRKALKWTGLKELDVKIREVKLNKKVLRQGRDEELSKLQSWLYNQTCGRVGEEDTMQKYLATTADGLVEWLKQILNLDSSIKQLETIFKEL